MAYSFIEETFMAQVSILNQDGGHGFANDAAEWSSLRCWLGVR